MIVGVFPISVPGGPPPRICTSRFYIPPATSSVPSAPLIGTFLLWPGVLFLSSNLAVHSRTLWLPGNLDLLRPCLHLRGELWSLRRPYLHLRGELCGLRRPCLHQRGELWSLLRPCLHLRGQLCSGSSKFVLFNAQILKFLLSSDSLSLFLKDRHPLLQFELYSLPLLLDSQSVSLLLSLDRFDSCEKCLLLFELQPRLV